MAHGPVSIRQALEWIREAAQQGRYLAHDPHFSKRCRERNLSLADALHALRAPKSCQRFDGREPSQGGTNWRVTGPSVDGDLITVGVEAFLQGGRWILLITLFE